MACVNVTDRRQNIRVFSIVPVVSCTTSLVPEVDSASLQARAMTVNQVLFGYYTIPTRPGAPLEVVVNPEGNDARRLKRLPRLPQHILAQC